MGTDSAALNSPAWLTLDIEFRVATSGLALDVKLQMPDASRREPHVRGIEELVRRPLVRRRKQTARLRAARGLGRDDDVMDQEPYRSAHRGFWIVDNGSSHRGERAAEELRARHPHIVIVHTPTYASWLNQIGHHPGGLVEAFGVHPVENLPTLFCGG